MGSGYCLNAASHWQKTHKYTKTRKKNKYWQGTFILHPRFREEDISRDITRYITSYHFWHLKPLILSASFEIISFAYSEFGPKTLKIQSSWNTSAFDCVLLLLTSHLAGFHKPTSALSYFLFLWQLIHSNETIVPQLFFTLLPCWKTSTARQTNEGK